MEIGLLLIEEGKEEGVSVGKEKKECRTRLLLSYKSRKFEFGDYDMESYRVGSLDGKKKVEILCIHETRWTLSHAYRLGAGLRCSLMLLMEKVTGVILKATFSKNLLEVKGVFRYCGG